MFARNKRARVGGGGRFGLMLCAVTETVRLNLMEMKRHGVLLERAARENVAFIRLEFTASALAIHRMLQKRGRTCHNHSY